MTDTFFFKDTTPGATPKNNKTGSYGLRTAKFIADEAKARGIAPERALAVAMVESNLGKKYPSNPLQVSGMVPIQTVAKYAPEKSEATATRNRVETIIGESTQPEEVKQKAYKGADMAYTNKVGQANIKAGLDHLQAQAKTQRDPLLKLQAYNGLGVVGPGTEGYSRLYGSKKPIDMKKNPVWAKKVIAYEKALKGTVKSFGMGGS